MITPDQVGERYLAVQHRMFRAFNDEMSGSGLSLARTKVLLRLREQGPARPSVLLARQSVLPSRRRLEELRNSALEASMASAAPAASPSPADSLPADPR